MVVGASLEHHGRYNNSTGSIMEVWYGSRPTTVTVCGVVGFLIHIAEAMWQLQMITKISQFYLQCSNNNSKHNGTAARRRLSEIQKVGPRYPVTVTAVTPEAPSEKTLEPERN